MSLSLSLSSLSLSPSSSAFASSTSSSSTSSSSSSSSSISWSSSSLISSSLNSSSSSSSSMPVTQSQVTSLASVQNVRNVFGNALMRIPEISSNLLDMIRRDGSGLQALCFCGGPMIEERLTLLLPYFRNITQFCASRTSFDNACLAALAQCRQIRRLNLDHTFVTEGAVASLSQLENLEELSLRSWRSCELINNLAMMRFAFSHNSLKQFNGRGIASHVCSYLAPEMRQYNSTQTLLSTDYIDDYMSQGISLLNPATRKAVGAVAQLMNGVDKLPAPVRDQWGEMFYDIFHTKHLYLDVAEACGLLPRFLTASSDNPNHVAILERVIENKENESVIENPFRELGPTIESIDLPSVTRSIQNEHYIALFKLYFSGVRTIRVCSNESLIGFLLGSLGIIVLNQCQQLKNLHIEDFHLLTLVHMSNLARLNSMHRISFVNTNITDALLPLLSDAHLRTLELVNCPAITDAGLISAVNMMPELQHLIISNGQFSNATIDQLRNCNIQVTFAAQT